MRRRIALLSMLLAAAFILGACESGRQQIDPALQTAIQKFPILYTELQSKVSETPDADVTQLANDAVAYFTTILGGDPDKLQSTYPALAFALRGVEEIMPSDAASVDFVAVGDHYYTNASIEPVLDALVPNRQVGLETQGVCYFGSCTSMWTYKTQTLTAQNLPGTKFCGRFENNMYIDTGITISFTETNTWTAGFNGGFSISKIAATVGFDASTTKTTTLSSGVQTVLPARTQADAICYPTGTRYYGIQYKVSHRWLTNCSAPPAPPAKPVSTSTCVYQESSWDAYRPEGFGWRVGNHQPLNNPPSAALSGPGKVAPGHSYSVVWSAGDPEGKLTRCTLDGSIGLACSGSSSGGSKSFTMGSSDKTHTLRVIDHLGKEVSKSVTVRVDKAPTVTLDAPSPVAPYSSYKISWRASSPDGDSISCKLNGSSVACTGEKNFLNRLPRIVTKLVAYCNGKHVQPTERQCI